MHTPLQEPLRCKVEGLTKKEKVVFRVIAVNKAGESPPSDPSDLHTVWYKKCKSQSGTQHRLKCKLCAQPFKLQCLLKSTAQI